MKDIVERVIATARTRLGDQLTLDELAKMAVYSKYHFARAFRQVTGLSPGRFLSAMRLHEAKRLLLTTSLSVVDISYRVGYNSVGTFTSRFTASVGVTPIHFRRRRGHTTAIRAADTPHIPGATLTTRVVPAAAGEGEQTFLGVFHTAVPEGRPIACTVLPTPGPWSFTEVPLGRWYVLAVSVSPSVAALETLPLPGELPTMVGMCGPVVVHRRSKLVQAEVRLRPMRPTDPPVLLALTDLDLAPHGALAGAGAASAVPATHAPAELAATLG